MASEGDVWLVRVREAAVSWKSPALLVQSTASGAER